MVATVRLLQVNLLSSSSSLLQSHCSHNLGLVCFSAAHNNPVDRSSTMTRSNTRSDRNASTTTPPPAYANVMINGEQDNDLSDCDAKQSAPIKIIVNARHAIKGHQNVVSPPQLLAADFAKFAAVLTNAVQRSTDDNADMANDSASSRCSAYQSNDIGRRQTTVRIDFTVNHDVQITGDRNVMGAVAIKPKSTGGEASMAAAEVDASKRPCRGKRKFEEVSVFLCTSPELNLSFAGDLSMSREES